MRDIRLVKDTEKYSLYERTHGSTRYLLYDKKTNKLKELHEDSTVSTGR